MSEEPENIGESHLLSPQTSKSEHPAAALKSLFFTNPSEKLFRARAIFSDRIRSALATTQVPFSDDLSNLGGFILHWYVGLLALVAEIKASQVVIALMVHIFLHICISLSGLYFTKDAAPRVPLLPKSEVFRVQLYNYRHPPVGW